MKVTALFLNLIQLTDSVVLFLVIVLMLRHLHAQDCPAWACRKIKGPTIESLLYITFQVWRVLVLTKLRGPSRSLKKSVVVWYTRILV